MQLRAAALALGLASLFPGFASAERFLVPLLYNGPGTGGSIWFTRAVVVNRSPLPFTAPGLGLRSLAGGCANPEGCFVAGLDPGIAGEIFEPASPRGFFVELPDSPSNDVGINVRVAAFPRQIDFEGTDLPVPSEAEFRSDVVRLSEVPIRAPGIVPVNPFRTSLRVYSLPDSEPARVRLALRSPHSPGYRPALERDYLLLASQESDSGLQLPGYVSISLTSDFGAAETSCGVLEITPLPAPDGHLPLIWAFASATNDQSNEVTVVRPQATRRSGN